MIELTRLGARGFYLNSDLVESMESVPDTTIHLTNGKIVLVEEPSDEVVRRIVAARRAIFYRRPDERGPAAARADERRAQMACREKLEQYLRSEGVPFEVRRHATAFTAQQVAESEHVPGKLVAKVIVVFAGGSPAMLVIPASYRADLDAAARALGVDSVRLAQEDDFETLFPDCEVGAMPPFGNLYDMPVYVDRSLAEDETIVVQAGTHTETISLTYADYARLVRPTVAEFAHSQRSLAGAHT
ncbi:MAG TPA: flagellar FlbD family protein [Chloroflexota bacterium]|nr:flagellar FlbD family protein [Chloroflexota bacterium]